MKFIFAFLFIFSINLWAQDPVTYLNTFDSKVYSIKSKGAKDFVVDIESSKLTKQMNDQVIFGKINEVIFRIYWTATPERLAIEIHGLPEGFKEIKEELKLAIMSVMDSLLPISTIQRFAGYKFHSAAGPKEFVAQDTTGIAIVPSYIIRFDSQDRMIEVIGKKPIGELTIVPQYEKNSFSDGKWVLKSMKTLSSENGQTMTSHKELSYGESNGIGVLSQIKMMTEQKIAGASGKPLILEEVIEFKNYKINTGDAMKYFLSEGIK